MRGAGEACDQTVVRYYCAGATGTGNEADEVILFVLAPRGFLRENSVIHRLCQPYRSHKAIQEHEVEHI